MTKRTIFIILGALLVLLIIALGWWWFINWSKDQQGPAEGFGTAGDRTGTAAGGTGGNLGSPFGDGSTNPDGSTSNINLGNIGGSGSGGGGGGNGSGGGPGGATGVGAGSGGAAGSGAGTSGTVGVGAGTGGTTAGGAGTSGTTGVGAGTGGAAGSGAGTGGTTAGGAGTSGTVGVGAGTGGAAGSGAGTGGTTAGDPGVIWTGGSGGTGGGGGGGGGGGTGGTGGTNTGGTDTGGTGGTDTGGTTGGDTTPGVDWLPGGPQSSLALTPINQLNDGSIGGQVTLFGTPPQPNNPNDLTGALAVVGVGTALCTAGLLPGVLTGSAVSGALSLVAVTVNAPFQNLNNTSDTLRENFLNCIARTIARAALEQITASTVNWINSGFNGKPSFIQNYEQFFTNVADRAAGSFIQGSALSFLCSPFQAKIRIALAQSYATRNAAASCTLSRVSNNIQSFMNGNFNAGGWSGLLQFTTSPANNPFGAYSYAQVGLNNRIAVDTREAGRTTSIGGIMSSRKCTDPNDQRTCKVETPGGSIESVLAETLQIDKKILTQAGVSGSFDTIIAALLQQLTLRVLQNGLSNTSGLGGYASNFLTPEQQQAQAQGNNLLTALQGISNTAGQYGATAQGAINDIQIAQSNLQNLVNCHEARNNSAGAAAAQASIASLEQRVAFYNSRITQANTVIAALQNYQSQLLQATNPAQIATVQAGVDTAVAQGALITAAQVTTAQQDRTTLQAELAATNTATNASLAQCTAGQ